MPISDDEFIVPLLDTFGLKPFTGEETGTSVIIPYIDPSKLLEDIIPADAEIESGIRDHFETNWTSTLADYLKLAIQRWYSNFSIIEANNDDIWRYISVKVMPDITYLRYPTPEKGSIRINQKRFFSHTRRIWLKTLWWYIYLSWQGNAEDTFEVLKDNGVDNINKLIETPGRGYRLQLFRHMMLEYHKTRPHKVKDFAAFTKLNNAKCVSIEPELTCGGVAAYAQKLLEEVSAPKEVE